MGKQFSFYIFSFMISFSLVVQAADNLSNAKLEANALTKLHVIVEEELPAMASLGPTKQDSVDNHRILEMAKLFSVSPRNLADLFSRDCIASTFSSVKKDMRGLCENTSDGRLKAMYPIFKIGVAYRIQNENDIPETQVIMNVIGSACDPSNDGLSLLLLRSLNPSHNDIYYDVLYMILCRFNAQQSSADVRSKDTLTVHDIEQFARELLIAGKYVRGVNTRVFMRNPERLRLARKLDEWCLVNCASGISIQSNS